MNLRLILLLHAIPTFAAGLMLIIFPAALPAAVGIHLEPGAFFVCYLLGAAELSISFLSFAARGISDTKALRIISISFIILHVASALLEAYTLTFLNSLVTWINIGLRIPASVSFAYFGVYKLRNKR